MAGDGPGVKAVGFLRPPNLQVRDRTEARSALTKYVELLDNQGVAVRTGHHCTQPLMEHYGIPGTVRASFAIYNTKEEVDLLYNALVKAISMLK